MDTKKDHQHEDQAEQAHEPFIINDINAVFNSAPTSIKDSLPSYGIPIENAEKWNREYNHESLPRIHEDRFWGLLIEVAGDTNPADVEFESKVGNAMEKRNARSRAINREEWRQKIADEVDRA